MPYTLWRNRERLGEVVATLPSADVVVAGLFRASKNVVLGGFMQVRLPIPSGPVMLHALPARAGPSEYPLRRLSPTEAKGLAPEARFELRDEHGGLVEADLLELREESISEEHGAFPDTCRRHGLSDSVWILTARRHAKASGTVRES